MAINRNATSKYAVVTDSARSCDNNAGCDEAVLAHFNIVAKMAVVINFCSGANNCGVECPSINIDVGSNVNIIFYYHGSVVWDAIVIAFGIMSVAVAV